MPSQVELAAQDIANILAPTPTTPQPQWRWCDVSANNNDGTLSVLVGSTDPADAIDVAATTAAVDAVAGDRVRVMFQGSVAIADAVLATGAYKPPVVFREATSASASISSGSIVEFTAACPSVTGYTRKGVVQVWRSGGTENILIGAPWIDSSDNCHARVRANAAATGVIVKFYVMYTKN